MPPAQPPRDWIESPIATPSLAASRAESVVASPGDDAPACAGASCEGARPRVGATASASPEGDDASACRHQPRVSTRPKRLMIGLIGWNQVTGLATLQLVFWPAGSWPPEVTP